MRGLIRGTSKFKAHRRKTMGSSEICRGNHWMQRTEGWEERGAGAVHGHHYMEFTFLLSLVQGQDGLQGGK